MYICCISCTCESWKKKWY